MKTLTRLIKIYLSAPRMFDLLALLVRAGDKGEDFHMTGCMFCDDTANDIRSIVNHINGEPE